MERQIDKEIKEKNLFDKIMTFTDQKERVTKTIGNHGRAVSKVTAVNKAGQQSYKFQEIQKKIEAIEEKKMLKQQRKMDIIKE